MDSPDEFGRRLQETADRVTAALDHLIPRAAGPEARLMSAMRYSALSGGKRIRPFFVLEAGRLFGADEQGLLRVACAIESVHTYSLIHDDLPCMDDDDLRRGRPTAHKAYDEATAILSGDALLTLAFEILAEPDTDPEPQIRCELIRCLAEAAGARGMVGGQMMDMVGNELHNDLAAVTRMQRLKTGALISHAADAGAIMGRASQEARQALQRFTHDLGLAFQIADDLMDAVGTSDEAGKAVGKDAARGKANFVTILGVDGAKDRIRLLGSQARSHLAMFGSRAKTLAQSIDFVIDRRA
ncbi:MAG: polyprenyl synthetase family protein [Caulobacterales bacterium]